MSCFVTGQFGSWLHTTTLIGDLPGYGPVWYHEKGIANILSFTEVAKRYRITLENDPGQPIAFVVHKSDGTSRRFIQSDRGLYYLDTKAVNTGTVLVETVEGNKEHKS